MGKAELIEPFSDTYNEHAQIKKIPIEALKKHSNVEYAHIWHDTAFADYHTADEKH